MSAGRECYNTVIARQSSYLFGAYILVEQIHDMVELESICIVRLSKDLHYYSDTYCEAVPSFLISLYFTFPICEVRIIKLLPRVVLKIKRVIYIFYDI